MLRDAKPRFPQGSVIVKEKLLDRSGGKAELLIDDKCRLHIITSDAICNRYLSGN
jgi:hypothetical protein